jgi:hypothetical protein
MASRRGRKRKDELRVPSILLRSDVDVMAKRRCLLLLSVLSGQQTIREAINDAQISVGTYYQLESRALSAMLQALTPDSTTDGELSTWKKLSRLEARVKKLETDKRRLERLLALTKKVVRRGPMTRKRRSTTMDTRSKEDQPSIPTRDGEGAP